MRYYIGIDLGTSSVKLMLVNNIGEIVRTASSGYDLIFPQPGWSEQNPDDWRNAIIKAFDELTQGFDKSTIAGIGVAGQMHGLVILDENDNIIRPAILWNDGRTDQETDFLNNIIGKENLASYTGNIAFAGFTAPKILWLKENEPENFKRIKKIMLPKDYINYLLTGIHSTDYSDAAGTLLLDVKNKCWSDKMLAVCGVSKDQMPRLYESFDVIANILPSVAKLFGLPENTKVIAGAGDNAAAAIGTGCVKDGMCNISLGTSGTVFISSDKYIDSVNNAIHSFCHSNGKYHLMGCILSAASCNKWFYENILQTDDYAGIQNLIKEEMLGKNHTYFLPYLMGERSPINDTDARAAFIGMNMDTKLSDMALAIMEGVAFAIKENLEIAKESGITVLSSSLCGGGAKVEIWQKILADVLDITLKIPESEEGPGFGAALLAMVGCKEFKTIDKCADRFVKYKKEIKPDREKVLLYKKKYDNYKLIYPSLKEYFKIIK